MFCFHPFSIGLFYFPVQIIQGGSLAKVNNTDYLYNTFPCITLYFHAFIFIEVCLVYISTNTWPVSQFQEHAIVGGTTSNRVG